MHTHEFIASLVYTHTVVRWLFLLAYACSGLAGLIYEVSWTRLLTLYIGHTTAAASAVVAAFLGGLAAGAAGGGRLASRLTRRQCLQAYVILELGVAVAALALPWALQAVTPLLEWAYRDGIERVALSHRPIAGVPAVDLHPGRGAGRHLPDGGPVVRHRFE